MAKRKMSVHQSGYLHFELSSSYCKHVVALATPCVHVAGKTLGHSP